MTRLDAGGFADAAIADKALAQAVADHKSVFFAEKAPNGDAIDYHRAVSGKLQLVMPRQRVLASDVWLGALIAALLFTGGKFLIGGFIGRSSVASGFGAAGSLVVVLLWVYFSAQILLIGAEFTCVYARTFGSHKAAPVDP